MDMRRRDFYPRVPDRKLGQRIVTLSDLPPTGFAGRWTYSRKVAAILCCRYEMITVTELLDRYGISPEEYLEWCRGYEYHGVDGCRAKMLRNTRTIHKTFSNTVSITR
jgi:Protein of unknown function (DUF1153)